MSTFGGAGLYTDTNKPVRIKKKSRAASHSAASSGPRLAPPDKTPYAWLSEDGVGMMDSNGNAVVVRNF